MLAAPPRALNALASSLPSCDLLVLNPPFSMGAKKSVGVDYRGMRLTCSVAMAHILRSLERFFPRSGAVAIVPESLLHSEVDQDARTRLTKGYSLTSLAELRNTTFHGARANAAVVRLQPGTSAPVHRKARARFPACTIVRGGLAVFRAKTNSSGLPFLHSTDIACVVTSRSTASCPRVTPIERGIVAGCLVLVPRMGIPKLEHTRPIYLRSRVQLSDCVVAFRFRNMATAEQFCGVLRVRWDEFLGLYRGTGARYTTLARLRAWFCLGQESP